MNVLLLDTNVVSVLFNKNHSLLAGLAGVLNSAASVQDAIEMCYKNKFCIQ